LVVLGVTRLVATATCNNMVLQLSQLMLLADNDEKVNIFFCIECNVFLMKLLHRELLTFSR